MSPTLHLLAAGLFAAAALAAGPAAAGEFAYEGHRKCGSCHRSQSDSWKETAHAKAFESLAPDRKAEAKRKAGLDPAKDYRQDAQCLGCHTTGYGKDGGHDPKEPSEYLLGVTCESCHGPGAQYRLMHRKAGDRFERGGKTAERAELAELGQEFAFRDRCNACHMNYQGSPWPHAKPPYTPFTPRVDARYAFGFDKAVRDDKAMHGHFRLEGTFTGDPVAPFHAEFQAAAKPVDKSRGED